MLKNKKIFGFLTIAIILVFITVIFVPDCKARVNHSADGEKVVYLTFDDGPSSFIVPKTLDILKENNIKATFFIIGNRIKGREEILKRIHDEGHSIGLHTYSHRDRYVYSSHKNFIEEMEKASHEINNVIGVSPNIIRFPGGSCRHLTNQFLEELHSKNYRIYDWNVALSDGINSNLSCDRLYHEAINTGKKVSPLIILMHCSGENKTTCQALPRIIRHYKDSGYEFKPITDETPEFYFRIRK